jgi:hypothetical protein
MDASDTESESQRSLEGSTTTDDSVSPIYAAVRYLILIFTLHRWHQWTRRNLKALFASALTN